jgi:chromosome segregation ATPase
METDKVLLEIKEQLGKVDATTTAIKADIIELKQRDVTQSEELDKAYAKAKARQDSIRDDLQHQIDSNKTLILTVNESINKLNENVANMMNEMKNAFKVDISKIEARLTSLETKKEKTLAKWYDKIVDKLVWVFIIGALVVLLKWLNAPPEIMNQLPH